MNVEPPAGARIVEGRLRGARFLTDPCVQKIFALLDRDGEEARVVGGAVRDALIGAPVREVDFATTALPGVVAARAKAAELRTLPTGLDHGTITLLIEAHAFEVTTLREDVATDGRRAKVRFGRSFERDALRRDFTVNALSATADGRIYDYVGGLADLDARKLRFIGDPRTRIREDYLRSLRFLRFHAQFGEGDADPQALAAIVAERDGLENLSRERIRSELMKLLRARRAADAARLMSETGLAQQLLGGAAYPDRLAATIAIESATGAPADGLLRLAALAALVAEDADRLREKLRLANSEWVRLAAAAQALVALHGREAPPQDQDLRALLFNRGRRAAIDAAALAWAESDIDPKAENWLAALRFLREQEEPRAPFSGADLLTRGVPAGRQVGAILKNLQARWIRAGFPKDAATIARLLDEAAEAARRGPKSEER
jgi:poly(A) polymerase